MDTPPEVVLSCARCGSGAFNAPFVRDDSFVVTCRYCGTAIGTAGEIEKTAKNALEGLNKDASNDDLREALRKAFTNLKTIRIE